MIAFASVTSFIAGIATGVGAMYWLFSRAEEGIKNLQAERGERRRSF